MPRYNPAVVEPKWQQYWEANKTFRTPELPGEKKFYALDMFPYPSGSGLHVGHPEGYTATDILSRFRRMQGVSVLHPMGFDSFGLPAEEHAIKTGTHPRISTEKNIANFTRQLKMLGFSYDWDRQLATTDLNYVKWTQWIFLVLFDTWFDPQQQKGRPISELPIPEEVYAEGDAAVRKYQDSQRLAYQSEVPVNWCPALGTVLANEEVVGGVSERGGHPVERRPLRQWMLRITAYADRLEKDLDQVDWPESVKLLQRNWIGRSTGAEVDFFLGSADEFPAWQEERTNSGFPEQPSSDVLRVYTTRPDTLFGATYMVIAPEHPLTKTLTTDSQREAVEAYCQEAAFKSERDRTQEDKKKTGVFTGSYAINPVNQEPIPIWAADYVLASYGTGAIMAVPAHDERDFEFAKTFDLPIKAVVDPGQDTKEYKRADALAAKVASPQPGIAVNSGAYDGLATLEFKARITEDLAAKGVGRQAINYKLRDWLFSRQRFWGEPFPLLHEIDEQGERTGTMRAVDPADLPVKLPELEDFQPHGRPEPLLEKAPEDWLYVEIDGKKYKRETNTMPQWAGSCWYYLRYIDPTNDECFVDPEKEKAWMPVDLYIGGVEHAVLHLLYARFWHKVLFDRGHVSTAEPFQKLVNQGMILGEMEFQGFKNTSGEWVSSKEIEEVEHKYFVKETKAEVQPVKLSAEEVEKQGENFVLIADPKIRIESRAHKMSKSRGNVINPDDVVRDFGADSLRLFEMFMGPLEATKPWSTSGVSGVKNFLDRAWRMIVDDKADEMQLAAAVGDYEPTDEQLRTLHKTIKSMTEGLDALSFNTCIARLMEFTNFFTKQDKRPRQAMEAFVLMLSPFAPHMAEELWQTLGHDNTLAYEPWPQYDEALTVDELIEIPVQILGKVRGKISIAPDASKEEMETAARSEERIAALLEGKTIQKVIVIPGRMVNFVAK